MNVRTLKTGLAAAAIAASPMVTKAQTAVKTLSHNDSIVNVVKNAANKADTVALSQFNDANVLMKSLRRKAPKGMVTVTREQGKFVGKITPQGLNGDLQYTTDSKMILDPTTAPKTKVEYGLNYLRAQHLPKTAGELNTKVTKSFKKGDMVIKGRTYFGRENGDSKGGMKLGAAYNYKFGESGFSAGPQVKLHADLEKINNDVKGRFSPEIAAGAQFKHTFNNDVKVGLEGSVGVAGRQKYDARQTTVGNTSVTYAGEASVGYKNVDLVVGGGKDVHLGNNVAAGFRFHF